MIRLTAAAAALTVAAGAATAGVDVTGAWLTFQEVDNSAVASLAGFTTYDLYFNNFGNSAVQVNGFDLSSAAQPGLSPYRIRYTGNVYNDPVGNDVAPNPAFFPVFPALEFDSYFAIGGAAVQFVGSSVSWTGGEVLGTWFAQPPTTVGVNESIRFMRITVSGDVDFANSEVGVGFADNTLGAFTFVPTPGAAALLGLGGLVAGRRRR